MIPYISKSRKNGMCNQHGRLRRNQWLRKPPRRNTSHYNRIRLLLPTPWIPCQPKNIYQYFLYKKSKGFLPIMLFLQTYLWPNSKHISYVTSFGTRVSNVKNSKSLKLEFHCFSTYSNMFCKNSVMGKKNQVKQIQKTNRDFEKRKNPPKLSS